MTEKMTDNNQKIWEAIAASINGVSTMEQNQMVENWFEEDNRNKELYNHLQATGYNGSFEKALKAKERIFGGVKQRIIQSQYRKVVRLWQYVAAASIALLLSVTSIYLINYKLDPNLAFVESISPNGVRSKIILPDGTLVNLNAGSTLFYPSEFKGKQRRVILDGEAYFEVTKDKKHPFLVDAGEINVKVLGTHFNVKAYSDDEEVITSLVEGSVSINKKDTEGKGIILQPNQQAIYERSKETINVHEVKAELFAFWKKGGYYFDGETLQDIVRSFERGFNVSVEIQSEELKNEVFSGVFDREESLHQILDIIKKHRNFDYKTNADNVVIFKN